MTESNGRENYAEHSQFPSPYRASRAFHIRIVSLSIRQRLTLLLTCSMRTRRRAISRLSAFCSGVNSCPRGFFVGWMIVHALQRERLKAQVLQQVTPGRKRIRRRVGHALVVDAALMGLTQEQDAQRRD